MGKIDIFQLIEKTWNWFFVEKRPVGFLAFVVLIGFCGFLIFDNWNLREKLDLADVDTIKEIKSKVDVLWENGPRILSKKVANKVIANLNLMPHKYKISILTCGDDESARFGEQIREIFKRANWPVEDMHVASFVRPSELKIGFLCKDTENRDFQKAISPILEEYGYPYISNEDMKDKYINYSSCPDGEIEIFIGTR